MNGVPVARRTTAPGNEHCMEARRQLLLRDDHALVDRAEDHHRRRAASSKRRAHVLVRRAFGAGAIGAERDRQAEFPAQIVLEAVLVGRRRDDRDRRVGEEIAMGRAPDVLPSRERRASSPAR